MNWQRFRKLLLAKAIATPDQRKHYGPQPRKLHVLTSASASAQEVAVPRGHTTLAAWLIESDAAHPFWCQWMVSIAHLRPVDGLAPPVMHYAGAQYELCVYALDPAWPADANKPDTFHILLPVNVARQFHGVDDRHIPLVAKNLARRVLDAPIMLEPVGITDALEWWYGALVLALEHARKELEQTA